MVVIRDEDHPLHKFPPVVAGLGMFPPWLKGGLDSSTGSRKAEEREAWFDVRRLGKKERVALSFDDRR